MYMGRTLSRNLKYSKLSVKLKQSGSSYPFLPFLVNICALMACQCILVKYLEECFMKFIDFPYPVHIYVSSSIIYYYSVYMYLACIVPWL